MTRSDEIGELASALSAAQAEFTAVPRDSVNPFFRSKYASLATVIKSASPILTKHGLAVTQLIGMAEGGDTLTTWLLHKSGQFICETMRLHLTKMDAQGQGSATTYARRYSYMAVLGLVADEDDDGAGASNRRASTPVPTPRAEPANGTERVASAKQRGLINARAADAGLTPTEVAGALLLAAGQPAKSFGDDAQAMQFVNRQLDRLPARLVGPLLDAIQSVQVPS